jgi:hypothetical protein
MSADIELTVYAEEDEKSEVIESAAVFGLDVDVSHERAGDRDPLLEEKREREEDACDEKREERNVFHGVDDGDDGRPMDTYNSLPLTHSLFSLSLAH